MFNRLVIMTILFHCFVLALTIESVTFVKVTAFGDDVCNKKEVNTSSMTMAVSLTKCCSKCIQFGFSGNGECYAVDYTGYDKTCRLILYEEYKYIAPNDITCMLYQVNSISDTNRQAMVENITSQGINQLAPVKGNWIVVQQRVDGSISFDRNWADYKKGFGDLMTNFWFGLENMFKLSSMNPALRIEVLSEGVWYIDTYKQFKISSEAEGYKIHIGEYYGNNGDVIKKGYSPDTDMQDMKFSTRDYDNDPFKYESCAGRASSGWWFQKCHSINLNGPYNDVNNFRYYKVPEKKLIPITTCRMLVSIKS